RGLVDLLVLAPELALQELLGRHPRRLVVLAKRRGDHARRHDRGDADRNERGERERQRESAAKLHSTDLTACLEPVCRTETDRRTTADRYRRTSRRGRRCGATGARRGTSAARSAYDRQTPSQRPRCRARRLAAARSASHRRRSRMRQTTTATAP